MADEVKNLLTNLQLPDFVANLFDLCGIRTLEDLSKIDSQTIENVELSIRDGLYAETIDFTLTSNKIKYLGFDYRKIDEFKFRPFDLKKIQKIPEMAKNRIKEIYDDLNNILTKEKKAPKPSIPEIIAANANQFLNENSSDSYVYIEDIQITSEGNSKSINMKCPICLEIIHLGTSKIPQSNIQRFKKHFNKVHSLKSENTTEKLKIPPISNENLAPTISEKLNSLLQPHSIFLETTDITIEFDEETKLPKQADFKCPLCKKEKSIRICVNHKGIPIYYNVLHHFQRLHDLTLEDFCDIDTSNCNSEEFDYDSSSSSPDSEDEDKNFHEIKFAEKLSILYELKSVEADVSERNIFIEINEETKRLSSVTIECPLCQKMIHLSLKDGCPSFGSFYKHSDKDHGLVWNKNEKKSIPRRDAKPLENLVPNISQKLTSLLREKSIDFKVTDIKIGFDEETNIPRRADIACPLCGKNVRMFINRNVTPIYQHVLKHFHCVHDLTWDKHQTGCTKPSNEEREDCDLSESKVSNALQVKFARKISFLYKLKSIEADINESNIFIEIDEKSQLPSKAEIECPLCQKMITLAMSNEKSPSLWNFYRHSNKAHELVWDKNERKANPHENAGCWQPHPLGSKIAEKLSSLLEDQSIEAEITEKNVFIELSEDSKLPSKVEIECPLCEKLVKLSMVNPGNPSLGNFYTHSIKAHDIVLEKDQRRSKKIAKLPPTHRKPRQHAIDIAEKLSFLFDQKSVEVEISENNVFIEVDEETEKPIRVDFTCPLCEIIIKMSFNNTGCPILSNFYKHAESKHNLVWNKDQRAQVPRSKRQNLSSSSQSSHVNWKPHPLSKTIAEKLSFLFDQKSVEVEVTENNVFIEVDEETEKPIRVDFTCPLCENIIKMNFNNTGCPILANFYKHGESKHNLEWSKDQRAHVPRTKRKRISRSSHANRKPHPLSNTIVEKLSSSFEKKSIKAEIAEESVFIELCEDSKPSSRHPEKSDEQVFEKNQRRSKRISKSPPKHKKPRQHAIDIAEKLSFLFDQKSVEVEITENNIFIEVDEETEKPIRIDLTCPLCEIIIKMSFNNTGCPILSNFYKHAESKHNLVWNKDQRAQVPRPKRQNLSSSSQSSHVDWKRHPLSKTIAEKLSFLYGKKSVEFDMTEEKILIEIDEDANAPKSVVIICPLCGGKKRNSINQFGYPCLKNFYLHLKRTHDLEQEKTKLPKNLKRKRTTNQKFDEKFPKIIKIKAEIQSDGESFPVTSLAAPKVLKKKIVKKSPPKVKIQKVEVDEDIQCQICHSWFIGNQNFRRHQRRHQEAHITYTCDECGACYKDKKTLIWHIKVKHLLLRPYKCQICQKTFTQSGPLRRHKLMEHYNDEVEEQPQNIEPINEIIVKEEPSEFYFDEC